MSRFLHERSRTMLNGVLGLLGIGAAVFAALCALLYFRQESLIFFPLRNEPQLREQWRSNRVEIRSGDLVLEGWWADNPSATGSAVVLYFGGNAEDILYTAATARQLNARRMLVTNYRGYGATHGKPSQAALFEDALNIYDYVVNSAEVAPDDIIAMGRSLGSSVAAMLAAERRIRAAILVTPFDSLSAVASRHYPFLPVRALLRHPFPSIDYARRARVPALFLVAEHDYIIPPVHARRLYDAWAGEKRIHVLPAAGHNDLEQSPEYYKLVNEFLRETQRSELSIHPSITDESSPRSLQ